ncbi:FecR domain-containing protein [Aliifodinibius sp. S!AR15-10]|uniref:FecR family protein n=1 Tax=Aliifodinibius sp. S!AR15-10 TaxID=2950437 RepID=UPI00285FEE30|nr:FecR domain-containing protein [Aliifodinibius sp. S!AR15-10]MDR8394625.1 FecR domain-containing protein [Aliifodinibius sp. S!AR15-10]
MENWNLIQRYITGNASPKERRELWHWMGEDPKNRELVRQLEEIWELTPEDDFETNVEHAWEQFQEENMERPKTYPIDHRSHQHTSALPYLFRAAAAVLVILLAGYFAQSYLANSNAKEPQEFYVMQDLVTDRGEKASVTFSDGTQVILNAASSLRFPKKFDGAKREVYLNGEAYFKVTHNQESPFIVHTKNADIKVLGTEFNVQGWEEDTNVDVTVSEGKVSVQTVNSNNTQEAILARGEYARVEEQSGLAPVERVKIENHLLWTQGGMHFNNVPLKQVFRHLERKFDVQITVPDKDILDVPYTGTFRQAELDEIIYVLSASIEMDYERNGSLIEFKE